MSAPARPAAIATHLAMPAIHVGRPLARDAVEIFRQACGGGIQVALTTDIHVHGFLPKRSVVARVGRPLLLDKGREHSGTARACQKQIEARFLLDGAGRGKNRDRQSDIIDSASQYRMECWHAAPPIWPACFPA